MFTVRLRKISFWLGVAMAGAIPFVPVVFRYLHPPQEVKIEQSVSGLASLALNILGGIGDGILVMVWVSGFGIASAVASLVALAAAWIAREPRRTKLVCLLPALLAVIAFCVLVTIGA